MRKYVIALVVGLLALVWLTAGAARAKGITTILIRRATLVTSSTNTIT